MEDSRLRDLLRRAVQASIQCLAPRTDRPTSASRQRWVRLDDGRFALQAEHSTIWNLPEATECSELMDLSEVRELERFAHQDSTVAPQLGQMVGTMLGGSIYMTVEAILIRTIEASVGPDYPLTFDETKFADFYPRLQSGLFELDVLNEIVAPLYGVRRAPDRIDVDSHLAVGRLSDDEIASAIQFNLITSLFGPMSPVVAVPTHAIRISYRTPKLVEDPGDIQAVFQQRATQRRTSPPAVEDALTLLRLYSSAAVGVLGQMHYIQWDFKPGLMTVGFQPISAVQMVTTEYVLNDDDREPLQRLWKAMSSPGAAKSKGLQMALRRLSYGRDRPRPEDQLVDLMIAAEALFLSDTRKDRSELGYRLALRAAKFIESPDYGQREVFEMFRQAYSARSALVHGSSQTTIN